MTTTFFILGTAFLMLVELAISKVIFIGMGRRFGLVADILGVASILALGWLLKFEGTAGTKICESSSVPDSVAQYGLTFDTPGCVNHFTYFTNLGGLTDTTLGFDPFLAAVVTYIALELAHKVIFPLICNLYRRIF
ncbi:hypothetical protein C1X59_13665 [Pseudomonas sp. FW215-R2]|uniref:hypothetical protein n=1 Tax=unclassified Pseudomonas TaxID=196821 RepID=UPI000C883630|nr:MULTISPECIES: hypothetical protein [unclassified Pseudomonas]PMX00621.1 hypothetical protein C1X59_13665 [Pseudomonas sp. FW215-R2]PMX06693.1 hypothetical protein C1X60_23445 [Pseudomonas sp. FW215-L1]PMX18881.1 hypothetical protein C1X57_26215 [Pseudomonas sp. FW215-E1]PNA23716.1 hypothetical protein C1X58_24950 [Pseudomonas sp. FW215-R4]